MSDSKEKIKQLSYTFEKWFEYKFNPLRREPTEEENKIIEELKTLEAWKTFSKSEYFTKFSQLKIDFSFPIFGIVGRSSTDYMPQRFAKIPKVLEFFGVNGEAERYQNDGLSALDIFVIFNYNFYGLQVKGIRKRDNKGRDFFPQEHMSIDDINTALKTGPEYADGHKVKVNYSFPIVIHKRINHLLAQSFKTITQKIDSFRVSVDEQNTDEFEDNKPYSMYVCRHDKCNKCYLGLTMVCCKKPVCFACVVQSAEKCSNKWLFEQRLIPCDTSKCKKGLVYPINSDQVITENQYRDDYRRLSVCDKCKRGYAGHKHFCDERDQIIAIVAENPDVLEYCGTTVVINKKKCVSSIVPIGHQIVDTHIHSSETLTVNNETTMIVNEDTEEQLSTHTTVSDNNMLNVGDIDLTSETVGVINASSPIHTITVEEQISDCGPNEPYTESQKSFAEMSFEELKENAIRAGGTQMELWFRYEKVYNNEQQLQTNIGVQNKHITGLENKIHRLEEINKTLETISYNRERQRCLELLERAQEIQTNSFDELFEKIWLKEFPESQKTSGKGKQKAVNRKGKQKAITENTVGPKSKRPALQLDLDYSSDQSDD